MKSYILTIVSLFIFTYSFAQLKTPELSPAAFSKQTVGLTEIELDYSRPSRKGRTIFGNEGLLPYGQLWRTGANAATKITFSDPVFVDGQALDKGSYTIISIPQTEQWTVNWYPYESSSWNSYESKDPLIQLTLPADKVSELIESLEIHVQDIATESANLVIAWEHTRLKIPLTVNVKEPVLKSIERTMAGPNKFEYYRAALYLHESNIELDRALEYIQKATALDNTLFFIVTREALILKDLGRVEEAVAVAKRGLELSETAGNRDFVKLNEGVIGGE